MAKKRRRYLAPASGLVFLLAAARIYGGLVPWGAAPGPFLLAGVRGPTLTSPDGARQVDVHFNDAGAAHSGNHWTWMVESSWLVGGVVVSEGYLGPEVMTGGEPVPLTWGPTNELTVQFCGSRYGG